MVEVNINPPLSECRMYFCSKLVPSRRHKQRFFLSLKPFLTSSLNAWSVKIPFLSGIVFSELDTLLRCSGKGIATIFTSFSSSSSSSSTECSSVLSGDFAAPVF